MYKTDVMLEPLSPNLYRCQIYFYILRGKNVFKTVSWSSINVKAFTKANKLHNPFFCLGLNVS